MSKIRFNFKGGETIIQCYSNEYMEEICKRYAQIINLDIDKLIFIYSGNIINGELKYEEQINEEDKLRNEVNILVYEQDKTIINKKKIKLKEIICPICQENIFMKIKNYQINLNQCKNGHNINNILLKEFDNMQNVDISKIICDICKIKNKNNTFNNEFYKCNKCKMNLCPLCKSKHDNNHSIINYDERNYICDKHNDYFINYCKDCDKNMCKECGKEHYNHYIINYESILPNENIINNINDTKIYIDKLNKEINDIIKKLENIKENLELYYNISNNIINNNDVYKNYQKLYNINEFINFNYIIINDIKEIINEKDIKNKFKYIFNIHEKINKCNNYIIAELYVKEEDINKDIRIINSFEQYKRETNRKNSNNDYIYENEKEIKENCKIKINDEIIPFSYFYKFKNKGKYIIQYSFINKLKKICHMFRGCESLSNINLSNFDTQNVINMACMFIDCKSLTNINLSNLNTQNVNNIGAMFSKCESLINIDLSNFNTQNVINMSGMFYGCKSLINIDLSNFNTQNVTNMSSMFGECESLKYLNLSNFDIHNVKNMVNIFFGCNSLQRNNIITKEYKILEKK